MGFVYAGFALTGLLVVVVGWFNYQLLLQNGRALTRIESIEKLLQELAQRERAVAPDIAPTFVPAQQLAQTVAAPSVPHVQPAVFDMPQATHKHPSLDVGAEGPDFSLPDLDGVVRSNKEWRGRKVLLIFSSANCGFCTQMGPDLASIDFERDTSLPIPIVCTNGDIDENRQWVREHGLRFPVLMQQSMEIANLYRATGTPMGYLLDEKGCTMGEIAVGAGSLLDLVTSDSAFVSETAHQNGHAHKGNKELSESKIARDGLAKGTVAPAFTLPTLDAKEISLSDYLGRHVLLVFSDPQCGPCLGLDPILEARHKQRPDVSIIMVSRGTKEANREMVADHGLTFPLVLQKQWEISKLYAMFATPVAYLVDDTGVICADLAVGADEILALLAIAEGVSKKEVIAARV